MKIQLDEWWDNVEKGGITPFVLILWYIAVCMYEWKENRHIFENEIERQMWIYLLLNNFLYIFLIIDDVVVDFPS